MLCGYFYLFVFIFGVHKIKYIGNLSFTLLAIVLIIITFSLGVWQLKRLEWKNNLIVSFDSLKNSLPVVLEKKEETEFIKIKTTGTINRHKKIFFPAKTLNSEVGVRLASIFTSESGETYLLDEGWFSNKYYPYFKKNNDIFKSTITGYIRYPRKGKFFTPNNNTNINEWYTYDLFAIEDFLSTSINQKFFIKKMNNNNETFLIPSGHKYKFRNNHWQYAITWFSMSFSFLLLYLVYVKKNK